MLEQQLTNKNIVQQVDIKRDIYNVVEREVYNIKRRVTSSETWVLMPDVDFQQAWLFDVGSFSTQA